MNCRIVYSAFIIMLLTSVSQLLEGQVQVDFSANVREGCSSVQASFVDQSSSASGSIVSWKWDLGGVISELQSPGRIFASAGSFDICLTVTDDQGNSGTLCKEDFVSVYELPTADFEVDIEKGCAPLTVNFADLSFTPNGSIETWTWGLNGSNGIIETSNAERPVFSTYSDADSYTISLSVIDQKGCSNTVSKNDLINVLPTPDIRIGTYESLGCAFPMTVEFKNQNPQEDVNYLWDFGNGETFQGRDPDPILYTSEGTYDVKVIASNDLTGCTDSLVLQDYINTGGSISFDFFPKKICPKGSVQFQDLSPVEADSWVWDFGDGNTSSERDPSHTYLNPGSYTISLQRKTSSCDGTQISQYQVEVEAYPDLDFSINEISTCKLPAQVDFAANGPTNSTYRWYIGDPAQYDSIITAQNTSYQFKEYGSYDIRLLVDSELGCRSIKLVDKVIIAPLKARITGKTEGCIPFTANMGVTSNLDIPLTKVEWMVTGPESVTSNEPSFSLEISEVSNYDLQLTIENEHGCADTIRGDDILRGGNKPDVDFGLSDDDICPREVISFLNQSTGEADTWNWTFNDSIFSFVENPEMSFNSPGDYKVGLEVGHNGCYSYLSKDSLFYVNYPGVSFEIEYNCENPYEIKAINNSSEFDSLIWFYHKGIDTTILTYEDSLTLLFPDKEIYVLSLEAFNFENGCDNSVSDTVWISDLQAGFNTSVTQGCSPLEINFEDKSVDALSWKYFSSISRFNDDTIPNPKTTIRPPGEYTDVGLVVTDRHGCQDTAFADPIKVNAVSASFDSPDPVCINDTLLVNETSSSLFGAITNLRWTLGDNLESSVNPQAKFVLDEVGKYDLRLYAEDDWGCKDSISMGLGAFFRAPNFELAADSLSCTTHQLEFRNILHANSYTYSWSFGDGDSSSLVNPAHLYENEGDYQVYVRVEDEMSCVSEIVIDHLIQIADPIASFSADSTFAACPPLITSFVNNSQNGVGYAWNFGDDSGVSSEFDPSHLYIKAGIFDVELIASRSAYCKDTLRLDELVKLDGPQGDFTFDVDTSCVPLSVSFEANLAEEYTLIWDFGDGNLLPLEEKVSSSEIAYDYLKPGDFVPKIILEDGENCKITREGESIQTHDLMAYFETLDSVFCNMQPENVILNDRSFSTAPIINYEWHIDNQTYSQPNPSIALSDTGRYDVKLIVENAYCSDTLLKENYLKIGEAPFLVAAKDTFNCINTDINLTAQSLDLGDEFAWYNSEGEIISRGQLLSNFEINQDDYIVVQAVNEYDCQSLDTIHIEVIDDQTRFAGPDKTICYGDSAHVEINYGNNIFWETQSECDTCKSITLGPLEETEYPLRVGNEYGCIVRDTLIIDVLTQDDIEAGEDQNVCFTEKPVLLAFVQGDVRWSPANLVDKPTEYLTTAKISKSTMFYLESTVDQCTLRDSVYVNILEKANLEVLGDTICFGEVAHLHAFGDIEDVLWMGDEMTVSNSTIINPSVETESSTTIMAIGSLDGCERDTAYAEILVYEEIIGHLVKERNYFAGSEEVELGIKMTSNGDYDFHWTPAEMVDCSTCQTVMVKTEDSGAVFEVEVVDQTSLCIDTFKVSLRSFDDCESAESGIGVPNVFSPNEDGYNDLLLIEAPEFNEIRSIGIFDRWGQRVFFTRDSNISWDGRFNGQPVQSGVYTYFVEAVCPNTNEAVVKSGDVTVLR